MTTIRYCPACGSSLDDAGICTNEKCVRRALQLNAQVKEQAAEAAREAQAAEVQKPEEKDTAEDKE